MLPVVAAECDTEFRVFAVRDGPFCYFMRKIAGFFVVNIGAFVH